MDIPVVRGQFGLRNVYTVLYVFSFCGMLGKFLG